MLKRRVAVLYSHPLFGEGLAQLLHSDGGLAVTCLRADPSCNHEEISRLSPHAIIVEDSADEAFMRDLLRCLPPALLIRVSLQDNVMEVYSSRHVVSACPADLLEAIRLGVSRGSRQVAGVRIRDGLSRPSQSPDDAAPPEHQSA
jgi:hypothetical protein